jgi:hypothetical protein
VTYCGPLTTREEDVDPVADLVVLLDRNAEHLTDHAHRELRGEVLDEVALALVGHVVEQRSHDASHVIFHAPDELRREPLGDERALLAVLLSVLMDHRRVGREVRAVAVGRRERLRVLRQEHDVVEAGNRPDLIGRVPIERRFLT